AIGNHERIPPLGHDRTATFDERDRNLATTWGEFDRIVENMNHRSAQLVSISSSWESRTCDARFGTRGITRDHHAIGQDDSLVFKARFHLAYGPHSELAEIIFSIVEMHSLGFERAHIEESVYDGAQTLGGAINRFKTLPLELSQWPELLVQQQSQIPHD